MKKALYRLESYYKQHSTETEKEVLMFLINHTREAVEIDIHTLAKKCYCSASTIVRICKKNDFKGFRDLKLALMNDINFSSQLDEAKIKTSSADNFENSIINTLNENIMAIKNVYSLVDTEELKKIINLLVSKRFVYLFGIGASFLVAKDFQQKFERINKRTFLYEDLHLQLLSSTNIEKNDIVIIISYSGQTKEIIEIAKNIKSRGGIIIAITKYGSSTLNSLSDYNLYVPKIEQPLRVSASSSRISQLCIIDLIYHGYLASVGDESMDKIIYSNKLLEKEE